MDSYGDGNVYRGQVCKDSEIKTIEIDRYNADVERLVEAAACALTALNIASRQLTEDMKCVLEGKRWGGMDIDRLKAALEPFKK